MVHLSPLPMEFSRQEYWSGLPCLPPQDLPNPGIEPAPLACPALAGRFFTTSATSPCSVLSGQGLNASTCCAHHRVVVKDSTSSHILLNLQNYPKPESLSPLFYKWKFEAHRGEVMCPEWLSHVGGARLTLWAEDWSRSPLLPTPPPYLRTQPPPPPLSTPPTWQPTQPCCGVLSMRVLSQYLLGGNRRPLGNQEMIAWLPPSPDRIKEQ